MRKRNKVYLSVLIIVLISLIFVNIILLINNITIYNKALKYLNNMQIEKAE